MLKLFIVMAAVCCGISGWADIVLKPVIVKSGDAAGIELHAVKELAGFLSKAVGSDFTVVDEDKWDGDGPVILYGKTRYAGKFFPEAKDFSAEEWLIAVTPERNVVITGGEPRGGLYGVYEFLEKYAGCRFLAVGADYVPKLGRISVPARLREQGKPYFPFRRMSLGVNGDEHYLYYARNRIQGIRKIPVDWGGWNAFGAPGMCHTFGIYSQSFPGDKPELYSLDRQGRRLAARNGTGPGQLCLSNPEVRALMKAKLRENIGNDRIKADREGMPFPVIYDISQNDNLDYCRCAGCNALAAKYGGQSGALLDFINDIAGAVAVDYPDIFVQTFAYLYTEAVPKGIVPAENVMMQLAFMGREFGQGRDPMRSIGHPNNAGTKRLYEQWAKIAPNLATWDYGRIWEERFPTPYTFVRGQEANLAFYAGCNIKSIFLETEVCGPGNSPHKTDIQSFCDLKNYHFARLMLNPFADSEAIIDDFMKHFYGPAADAMKEWLAYFERRMNDEPGYLGGGLIAERRYLDRDFFVTTEEMLSRAENLVKNDPVLYQRVRQERFMVDYCMLNLWDRLFAEAPFGVRREDVLARLGEIQDRVRARYFEKDGKIIDPDFNRLPQEDARRLAAFSHPAVPLPGEFAGKKVMADFPWPQMQERFNTRLRDDPAAMGGKAMRLGEMPQYKDPHGKPFELGVYDPDEKKILIQRRYPLDELPKDEKYHWLVLKNVQLTPKCRMWGHWSWTLFPAMINDAYSNAAPYRKYDLYFSVKFEGPSYVPGSTRPDAVWMDRVVIVNPE